MEHRGPDCEGGAGACVKSTTPTSLPSALFSATFAVCADAGAAAKINGPAAAAMILMIFMGAAPIILEKSTQRDTHPDTGGDSPTEAGYGLSTSTITRHPSARPSHLRLMRPQYSRSLE